MICYFCPAQPFFKKILSGLDNYKRNTGTMHPFAVKRSDRGAGVPLTTQGIVPPLWVAEISIGTPPQTLKGKISSYHSDACYTDLRHTITVVIDTGSA
jgi:hypothetical protein